MSRTVLRPFRKAAELNLGGTSTSEKVFQDADSNAIILALPQGWLGPNTSTGRQFTWVVVRYGGRVIGGTTTNFTPQLQWGSSTTSTSNTDIESGAAVAVNSNTGQFAGVAEVLISVTGTGTARIEAMSNQMVAGSTVTYTAEAKSDNSITTYDPTLLGTNVGFVLTGTFSGGSADNKAYLDTFVAEVIE